MTIRKKIIGGFLIIFIIGLILGISGLISTSIIKSLSNEQYDLQNAATGVSSVLNAHYIWRHGITTSVLTESEFTGSLDPNTCALGKWKNSEDAKNVTDPELLSLLSQLDAAHNHIHNEAKNVIAFVQAGDLESAKTELTGNILPQTESVINSLTAMENRYQVMLDEKGVEILNVENTFTLIIIILLIVSAVVSVLLSLAAIKSIMRPIREIAVSAETIADGDIDVQINYTVNDEIGKLAEAFRHIIENTEKQVHILERMANKDFSEDVIKRSEKDRMNIALKQMADNLNNMFSEINASTEQVATGSRQIADGSQSLAQGSTEQAAAVEQLSSSITEIAEKTKTNAHMADKAAKLAGVIMNSAEKGSRQMDEMMTAVREINDASNSINKVIKVIDDIAFQTNILALNAAVEAARAGQHGKGFAVVAEEVRNLAAKSAEAAKDTGGLIANSMEKAEIGARIAGETAASLADIVSGIRESNKLVDDIAASSEEQSEGIEQINKGINQVASVVQQNSATAEESAASAQEISGQVDMLESLVAQFKLRSGGMGGRTSYISKKTPRAGIPQKASNMSNYDDGEYGKY